MAAPDLGAPGAVARLVPGAELFSDDDLEMLLNTLEHTFDGEAVRREIASDPSWRNGV
ncbi:hypothetical protein [Amycolatopsis sp. cmx-11-32]|uniref:hypothetical protein n=1 Tax=Amycolatopsis sp. cmx-11-32 TaxID=2785796 RepID=UPI0039E287E0